MRPEMWRSHLQGKAFYIGPKNLQNFFLGTNVSSSLIWLLPCIIPLPCSFCRATCGVSSVRLSMNPDGDAYILNAETDL